MPIHGLAKLIAASATAAAECVDGCPAGAGGYSPGRKHLWQSEADGASQTCQPRMEAAPIGRVSASFHIPLLREHC